MAWEPGRYPGLVARGDVCSWPGGSTLRVFELAQSLAGTAWQHSCAGAAGHPPPAPPQPCSRPAFASILTLLRLPVGGGGRKAAVLGGVPPALTAALPACPMTRWAVRFLGSVTTLCPCAGCVAEAAAAAHAAPAPHTASHAMYVGPLHVAPVYPAGGFGEAGKEATLAFATCFMPVAWPTPISPSPQRHMHTPHTPV